LSQFVRSPLTQYLFYDGLTDEPIQIAWKEPSPGTLTIRFENSRFIVDINKQQICTLDFQGNPRFGPGTQRLSWIRFYRYAPLRKFDRAEPGILIPPHGPNLFSVLYSSKALREWTGELFQPYGLAIVFKPHERTIELQKTQQGVVISYPLDACSDTLRRLLFYKAAMSRGQEGVLVFEEPEAHAFPYYTKYLGEQIASDPSNQYFLATHNPYFLAAVLEKAPRQDVAVFATRYENHETMVTLLTDEQIQRLMEADPFLGLSTILEGD